LRTVWRAHLNVVSAGVYKAAGENFRARKYFPGASAKDLRPVAREAKHYLSNELEQTLAGPALFPSR
jgi:hypothetical protein